MRPVKIETELGTTRLNMLRSVLGSVGKNDRVLEELLLSSSQGQTGEEVLEGEEGSEVGFFSVDMMEFAES